MRSHSQAIILVAQGGSGIDGTEVPGLLADLKLEAVLQVEPSGYHPTLRAINDLRSSSQATEALCDCIFHSSSSPTHLWPGASNTMKKNMEKEKVCLDCKIE
jgi:hypothetical protein